MTGQEVAAGCAARFCLRVEEPLKPLPEAGESLAALLREPASDAQPHHVGRVLVRIEGTRSHLHQQHSALAREGGARGP